MPKAEDLLSRGRAKALPRAFIKALPRQGESKKPREIQRVKLKALMLIWDKSAFP